MSYPVTLAVHWGFRNPVKSVCKSLMALCLSDGVRLLHTVQLLLLVLFVCQVVLDYYIQYNCYC